MTQTMTKEFDYGYRKVREEIAKALGNPVVKIGFLENGKGGEAHVDAEGARVIDVAFWNEFGTVRIPERAFLRTTFDGALEKIRAYADRLLGAIFDGKMSVEIALARIGQYVVDLVKSAITNWSTPPNAPSTIRKKGADNPLIDTGQMRASVQYEVIR